MLKIWRALDSPVGQRMALVNLGFTALAAGDLDRAEQFQAEFRHGAALSPADATGLALGAAAAAQQA